MKMTMKNELTLKHGVILAAAVLLIAGIAFAGAAAATGDEPVYVTWSESNITSAGGNFLVDVTGNKITPIHISRTSPLVLEKDLILDFQNVKLSYYATQSGRSGILANKLATNGSNLTIKNLIIDGGNVALAGESGTGVLVGILNSEMPAGTNSRGVITIQNVTISNLSIERAATYWKGGLIGVLGSGSACLIENVTIDNCSILGTGNAGGFVGLTGSAGLCVINCTLSNTSITAIKGDHTFAGGVVSNTDSPVKIENTEIKNCIINSSEIASGLFALGYTTTLSNRWELDVIGCTYDHCEFKNNTIHNCVIIGDSSTAGGLLSGVQYRKGYYSSNDVIIGNKLSYNTIVGNTKAAGFISDYRSTSNTQTINSNEVRSCCVVATNGDAAGFCV